MKKILALVLLLAVNVVGHAQELSFEQTVKYINEKISSTIKDGRKLELIADKKGNVKVPLYETSFNFFDLSQNTPRYADNQEGWLHKYQNGIELHSYGIYQSNAREYSLSVTKDQHNGSLISRFDNANDAERVFKALLHLRSLCTKEKDPFDN